MRLAIASLNESKIKAGVMKVGVDCAPHMSVTTPLAASIEPRVEVHIIITTRVSTYRSYQRLNDEETQGQAYRLL